VALEAEYRRQREPLRREHGPRAHGDDDGVGFERLSTHFDPDDASILYHEIGDPTAVEIRTLPRCRSHHRLREGGRIDLGRAVRRPEQAPHLQGSRGPCEPRTARRAVQANGAAVGLQAAVSPFVFESGREFSVQGEAASGEVLQRAPIAPVERQEAARLAGCRAGDVTALNDGDVHASDGEAVGDGCADDSAADNQHPHHSHPVELKIACRSPRAGPTRRCGGARGHPRVPGCRPCRLRMRPRRGYVSATASWKSASGQRDGVGFCKFRHGGAHSRPFAVNRH